MPTQADVLLQALADEQARTALLRKQLEAAQAEITELRKEPGPTD